MPAEQSASNSLINLTHAKGSIIANRIWQTNVSPAPPPHTCFLFNTNNWKVKSQFCQLKSLELLQIFVGTLALELQGLRCIISGKEKHTSLTLWHPPMCNLQSFPASFSSSDHADILLFLIFFYYFFLRSPLAKDDMNNANHTTTTGTFY